MKQFIDDLKNNPNFFAEKGASLIQIKDAEKKLGLKFAPDFKECLYEFGAISVAGHELTGFSADKNLDVVEATEKNREKLNFKKNLYVIEETHIDGIIVLQDSKGMIYEISPYSKVKKIANSLAEYLGANQQENL